MGEIGDALGEGDQEIAATVQRAVRDALFLNSLAFHGAGDQQAACVCCLGRYGRMLVGRSVEIVVADISIFCIPCVSCRRCLRPKTCRSCWRCPWHFFGPRRVLDFLAWRTLTEDERFVLLAVLVLLGMVVLLGDVGAFPSRIAHGVFVQAP